jgi:hypothetical protein
LCHNDRGVDAGKDSVKNLDLMRGWSLKDGVQYRDARNGEPVDNSKNVVTVAAAIETVFVLNDGHVAAIQSRSGPIDRRGVARNKFANGSKARR